MSFRDELKAIQNDIDKPALFDERQYRRRLNDTYEKIKKIIREDARKEKTNVLADTIIFASPSISSFAFPELCEVTKENRRINIFKTDIYVKVSLTGLGKRVFSDLVEKAKQDGISLSFLTVRTWDFATKEVGKRWVVWEHDTFQRWVSLAEYNAEVDRANPRDSHGRLLNSITNYHEPKPCCIIMSYEIHI